MILAATLSAGTLMACSSDKETNNTVSTVESETVESEIEESSATESESTESSELMEEQEIDAMTEAVLQHITVARVEKVAEDGTLDLTLFELPEASEEAADVEQEANTADAATETAGTEEMAELNESATTEETAATEETAMTEESAATEETTTTEEISATEVTAEEEETAEEENLVTGSEFDFTSLDLSMFVETELTESYRTEENVIAQLVEDDVLVEAALSDIQEGDMLVMFIDENEVPNIIIYRNIAQEEAAAE